MALTLTFPERVTEHNIEKLKQRVLNGARGGEEERGYDNPHAWAHCVVKAHALLEPTAC